MKIFDIVYKSESNELTEKYGSLNSYYDINGKKCFSVNVYEVTYKAKVYAHNKKSIFNDFSDNNSFIVSVGEVGEKEFHFEKLTDDNYIKYEGVEEVERVFIEKRDRECSPEVQEEYQRTGDLNPYSSQSDW